MDLPKEIIFCLLTILLLTPSTLQQSRSGRRSPPLSEDFANRDILVFDEPSDEFWRQFFDAYSYRGPLEHDPFFRPLSRPLRRPPTSQSEFTGSNFPNQLTRPSFNDRNSRPSHSDRFLRPGFNDDRFLRPGFSDQSSSLDFDDQILRPASNGRFRRPSSDDRFLRPDNNDRFSNPDTSDRFLRPGFTDDNSSFGFDNRSSRRPGINDRFLRPGIDDRFSRPEQSQLSNGFRPIQQESIDAREDAYDKYKKYFLRRFGMNSVEN